MYYYNISSGEYDDYHQVTLMHEKRFSNIKFAVMHNRIVGEENAIIDKDDIIKGMIEKFGFKKAEIISEIVTGYVTGEQINLLEVDNADDCIIV
ncbi:hypothetical protein ABD91_00380 [Lysinibacillus sphaericus]|uniref:hypothetical protein n=1 Tax=Lysinibacillus sphaericus TaxID=1421 RepID=UPI0018CFA8ED|nr:hypothetical protein [Lysinibacillus sphaericus]MBG9689388.1 hypothetical protein [Lysinibacillus sphaericus]